jgi:hypothetical protein
VLREVARRVRVLTGDGLEHLLHVGAAGVDGELHEGLGLGQHRQRLEQGGALIVVARLEHAVRELNPGASIEAVTDQREQRHAAHRRQGPAARDEHALRHEARALLGGRLHGHGAQTPAGARVHDGKALGPQPFEAGEQPLFRRS